MNVLQITNSNRPFFVNQCKALTQTDVNMSVMNIPIANSRFETRSIWDYAQFLPSVFRKSIIEDFDIVHANFGVTAPYPLLQPHLPSVITFWGSDLMANNHYSTINSKLANYFDSVILPSEIMSSYIECDHHLVPFGIDTHQFRPIDREEARKKVGWDQTANIALFPYSPTRDEKNYDLAQRVVSNANSDIELKTVYDVDYEVIPYYMNASDVVLVTSKRESGPMVVKEAASCNVPVVSTDVGFVSEALSNVTNSYVASSTSELKNQLRTVIDSGERSNGRKYAHKWGLDRMGERLIDVYQSVL